MSDETEVFTCRFCGGEEFYAWYTVDERQGIEILGSWEGELRFEYDGSTRSGDANSDDEYWCANCQAASPSLEYLVGLTDVPPAVALRYEFTPEQHTALIAALSMAALKYADPSEILAALAVISEPAARFVQHALANRDETERNP